MLRLKSNSISSASPIGLIFSNLIETFAAEIGDVKPQSVVYHMVFIDAVTP